ncbi:hypothetical protein [Mycolicibacterium sphagni]|uniref:Uncharacterized protein n=1 Tax=Mycolicibacterium sphagni TaxID=1786 RepID=A0ABX2K267_9MYCO|nr:hypothetical protein [Mycolicibacterium sphagni]NTY62159.1 hypothetical protein [Mycolicibacterium sphagni]
MNLVLLIFLIVAAVGVFLMWPGRSGTDSWWIGSGTRDSRGGRIRLLIGDVLLIGGLIGTTVVQLIGVRWGVGVVIMLVVQVVLVLLVGRLAVRHWRSTRNAPQPPTA